MIPIYVPSRSRPDRLGVLEQLSDQHLANTHVVVPESQYEVYHTKIQEEWNEPVPEVIGLSDTFRIGETRRWCAQDAAAHGHKHFLMVDDDIRFLVRQDIDDWRLREATIEDVDQMLAWMKQTIVSTRGLTLLSVSPREGNNRPGVGTPEDLMVMQQRIHRVYMWDTAAFLALEHLRVTVAEDFDLALQTLERGNQIAMCYYWGHGQRTTQDTGGASDYRTLEVHNAAVERLAELHPGIVRVVDKQTKGGGELSSRKESVISWQAAAELGQRRLAEMKQMAQEA
jgi:hypothetical protein